MDTNKIRRRTFLGSGITTFGAFVLPTFLKGEDYSSLSNNLLVDKGFIAESGVYKKSNYFVVGMITSLDSVQNHENYINQLRATNNYFSKLTITAPQ
jgi:hypothetical protein